MPIRLNVVSLVQLLCVIAGLLTASLVTLIGFQRYALDAAHNEMILSVNQLEHALTSPLLSVAQQVRTLSANQRGAQQICAHWADSYSFEKDRTVLREFLSVVYTNPIVQYAYQVWRTLRDPLNVAGDSGCSKTIDGNWGAFYIDSAPNATNASLYTTRYGYNESDFPALENAPYVIDPGTPWNTFDWPYGQALNTITPDDAVDGKWTRVSIWFEILTNESYPLLTYMHPLGFDATSGLCTAMFNFDLNLQSISNILQGLTGRRLDLMVFDVAEGNDDSLVAWTSPHAVFDQVIGAGRRASQLPDPRFASVLQGMQSQLQCRASVSLCNQTDVLTVDVAFGSGKAVITLRRFAHANMRLALIMFADRERFFAESDRAMTISIVVCVIAVVLVIAICFIVFRATVPPLHRVVENMQFAATFRNELVTPTSSVVTEISQLDAAFLRMNDRLLEARPFMPQAVVVGHDDEGELDDETNGGGLVVDHDGGAEMPKRNSHAGTTGIAPHQAADHHGVVDSSDRDETTRSRFSGSAVTHSTRAGGGGGGGHPIGLTAALSTDISLEHRQVVVVALNVVGYHHEYARAALAVPATSVLNDFIQRHAHLVQAVATQSALHKGIVEMAHGDQFLVSFNASTRAGSAPTKAVHFSLEVQRDLLLAAPSQDGRTAPALLLTAGIANGRCQIGNLGTKQLRQFTIVGAPVKQAFVLQRLARGFPEHAILATKSVIDDAFGATFYHKWIATVRLPPTRRLITVGALLPTSDPLGADGLTASASTPRLLGVSTAQHEQLPNSPAAASASLTPPQVACSPRSGLGESGAAQSMNADKEWLYEVHQVEERNPHRAHNIAFRAALAKASSSSRPTESATTCREATAPNALAFVTSPSELGHFFDCLA